MTYEKPPGLRKPEPKNHPYEPDVRREQPPRHRAPSRLPYLKPPERTPLSDDLDLITRAHPAPGHGLDFYELTLAPPDWRPEDAEAGCLCGQTWMQAPRQVVLYALIAHMTAVFYPPDED